MAEDRKAVSAVKDLPHSLKKNAELAIEQAIAAGWLIPEHFPSEVHQSLNQLRTIAKAAKTRFDPKLRLATWQEVALAELLRTERHCIGWSKRTGLPCQAAKVIGGDVCLRHGAAMHHVKAARERRLQAIAAPVLTEMYKIATLPVDKDTIHAKQRAAADLLDRAGVGAVVEAKVRQSYGGTLSGGVNVTIGFLAPEVEPLEVIDVRPEPGGYALPAATGSAGAGDGEPGPAPDCGTPQDGAERRET